jgi:hypothetical protein
VVLAGPSGVGKSRLAAAALEELRRLGWVSATVRATLAARGIPYGALAHLLPAEVPPSVANPLRSAADWLVTSGQSRRLALLVDDAHHLDAASAAVIHHVVQYRWATVVVTLRSGELAPDAIIALWKDNLASRMDLCPLSERGTGQVLAGALGGPATIRRLWRLTDGNALLLREVVLAARHSGMLSGLPWRLHAEGLRIFRIANPLRFASEREDAIVWEAAVVYS